MLVITLLGATLGWVGYVSYSLRWIKQREQFFALHRGMAITNETVPPKPLPRPPLGLRLLGEPGQQTIWVNDPDALDDARRLFPESDVRYHQF